MKRASADDSADSRVKVGHRQAIYPLKTPPALAVRGFVFWGEIIASANVLGEGRTDGQLDLLGFGAPEKYFRPTPARKGACKSASTVLGFKATAQRYSKTLLGH